MNASREEEDTLNTEGSENPTGLSFIERRAVLNRIQIQGANIKPFRFEFDGALGSALIKSHSIQKET